MINFLKLKKINTEIVLLFVGALALVFHKFFFSVSEQNQMIILLSLVLIVGVPHGALDFLVDEQNETIQNKKFSITKFVLIYLSRLFAFSLLWLLPWLAFSLFILFSIYHFGETDMSSFLKPNKKNFIVNLSYGALILSILLLSHVEEIQNSLPAVSTFLKDNNIYEILLQSKFYIILILFAIFLFVLYNQNKNGNLKKIKLIDIAQFVILISIISLLPLLLAFSFYFALWHSILSVRNIFLYFKTNNNSKNFTIICGKSLLFSFIALASIIGLYFALKIYQPDFNLLFSILVVLSVLTLPHLTVMHGMYKNYSKAMS